MYQEIPTNTLRINISGTIFQVQLSTLLRFPNSRLAKIAEDHSVSGETNVIYFDQDATLFSHVLRCCRSGEVHVPALICPREFLKELQFWGIPLEKISPCCWPTFYKAEEILNTLSKLKNVTASSEEYKNTKKTSVREKIWLFLDNPNYSYAAKVWYYSYLLIVGLSIMVFLLWMDPRVRVETFLQHVQHNRSYLNDKISIMIDTDPHLALFLLDLFCILIFCIEFVLRFATCPNKLKYFTKWYNIMNAVLVGTTVTAFILEVRKDLIHSYAMGFFYYVMKNSYVFRLLLLLRLEKRYTGLKILILSVKESARELLLLIFSLVMATCIFGGLIYCAEIHTEQFPDIGISLWWALVTISTVGYGDYYPTDLPGRIIGSLCAVCGIIMLALPIAVISSRFANFYGYRFYQQCHQNKCLSKG